MEKYMVMIADIESSKKVQGAEREALQQTLANTLEALNGNKRAVAPYTITLGDEFQAVYKSADGICEDILKILTDLHPVAVRFSLGVGTIETPINNEEAIGMDGPAFHTARAGMEKLKESGFLFRLSVADERSPMLSFINNSLQLLSQQIRGWQEKRIRILYLLKKGYDYKAVTKAVNISEAAFYKNKKTARLDVIEELSKNMARIVNQKIEN